MRVERNYREENVKSTNTWRLNNTLLNNQKITGEIKEEIKKYLETNDKKNMTMQNLWDAAKAVYSNTILPQEKRKILNKQSNLTLKGTRERGMNKTQS